jgi:DNA-binding NarL/FixJ family response regulator
MTQEKMNVLIVDDHAMIREGFAKCIQDSFPFVETFQANNGDEAIIIARQTPLNLVILDIIFENNERAGFDILEQLKAEFQDKICVVMTTGAASFQLMELANQAYLKKAAGLIPKGLQAFEQMAIVRDILSGAVPNLAPFVLRMPANSAIQNNLQLKNVSTFEELGLNEYEFHVLKHLVQYGKSNFVIAEELKYLTENEVKLDKVKKAISAIMKVFKVKNRVQIIQYVADNAIVLGIPELTQIKK